MGFCMFLFFFYVPLLICSLLCALPLLALAHLLYFPLSIWCPSFTFSCPSVLMMQYSRNCSMLLDGSMMISTSAGPLDFSLVFYSTAYLHRFISGCSNFLSYFLGRCPLSFIRCVRRSAHVLSLSRHHDASPYGSRRQGTKLKLSCFSSSIKLPGLKNL